MARSLPLGLLLAVIAVIAAIAVAADARAQGDPPPSSGTPAERAALAEALFEKGKASMAQHRYDEACPMFEESQRLDPGGGTLLTLALCHERQGKTATAWAEFEEARDRAVRDHETDRETVAKSHADALQPKLSRLTIHVDDALAKIAGFSLTRDGLPLARPAWGLSAPVDPGEHRVEAAAPGRQSFSATVRVDPDGASVRVDVPLLADTTPATTSPLAPIAPPPSGTSGRKIGGLALVGLGVVSIGIGAFYGVRAIVKQNAANGPCPTSTCNDPTANADNVSARSAAVVSDVAIPLGIVLGATGALLLVTAPKARPAGAVLGSWNVTGSPHGALATFGRSF